MGNDTQTRIQHRHHRSLRTVAETAPQSRPESVDERTQELGPLYRPAQQRTRFQQPQEAWVHGASKPG